LYAGIGSGDVDMDSVLQAAQQMEGMHGVQPQLGLIPLGGSTYDSGACPVIGVGNRPVEMAACCHPDGRHAISGEMMSAVVRVHRQDCAELLQMLVEKPESIIRVSWGEMRQYALEAALEIQAYERTGLLRDITQQLDLEGANILRLNSVTDKNSNIVQMGFTIEIANLQKLSLLLSRLKQIPNIFSLQRR